MSGLANNLLKNETIRLNKKRKNKKRSERRKKNKSKNTTSGKKEIETFLSTNKITFFPEHEFSGCINPKTKCLLSFDFYLPEKNICLEYDECESHLDDKKTRKENKSKYDVKNEFCQRNNIRIIRIPHYKKSEINAILDNELIIAP